jgi:hypothetical protein
VKLVLPKECTLELNAHALKIDGQLCKPARTLSLKRQVASIRIFPTYASPIDNVEKWRSDPAEKHSLAVED